MTKNLSTIEDLLEIAAGLRDQANIQLDTSDITIMHSIARQVFRGTALTDRQYVLMQEKLKKYKDQFIVLEYNFDKSIEILRQPIRHIDRSKYIKVINNEIVIRFPFKKTDVMLIQEFCNQADGYSHQKGSHEHIFAYTEKNVLNLLSRFSQKDFEIDDELTEIYNIAKEIYNSPKSYLSGIDNNKLININQTLEPYIENELGKLSEDTIMQFIDRRFLCF